MESTRSSRRSQARIIRMLFVSVCMTVVLTGGCATSEDQTRSGPATVNTVFPERDVVALARAADVIALGNVRQVLAPSRGTVVSAEAREGLRKGGVTEEEITAMTAEFKDFVFTDVVLGIDQMIKGDAKAGSIKFHTLGGQINGYDFEAPGYPSFTKGERVLVFLGRVFDGSLEVMAVYRIDGKTAASTQMGHENTSMIDVLIGQIEAHKNEPDPMVGSDSEEASDSSAGPDSIEQLDPMAEPSE